MEKESKANKLKAMCVQHDIDPDEGEKRIKDVCFSMEDSACPSSDFFTIPYPEHPGGWGGHGGVQCDIDWREEQKRENTRDT